MEYYVFDDEATAIAAEAAISSIGGAPLVGRNALTGEPEPDKCKSERWAIPQQRLDGKWVFPYVGAERIAQYPPNTETDFNAAFPYTLEQYSVDWFPQEEPPV